MHAVFRSIAVGLSITGAIFLAPIAANAGGDRHDHHDRGPLEIEKQGSFFAGGVPFFTQTGNDTDIGDPRNPGTATINQTYVEFQIPAKKRFKYPVLMMPGGGHTQKIYESTPDGRDGWGTYYVRKGVSVYLSDGVNRGSSSWDLTQVVLARQGNAPASAIPSMDRYTHETAWINFRIGPTFGVQHPGGQFPVQAFQQYANQLVPAFRDPIEDTKNVNALVAAIDKIGPVVLHVWSQSGRFSIQAALQRPNLVKGIVMVEPAGGANVSQLTPAQIAALSHIPVLVIDGDFSTRGTTAQILGSNATSLWLPVDAGITGNSHVMMIERNNLKIADLILDWIKDNVDNKRRPRGRH